MTKIAQNSPRLANFSREPKPGVSLPKPMICASLMVVPSIIHAELYLWLATSAEHWEYPQRVSQMKGAIISRRVNQGEVTYKGKMCLNYRHARREAGGCFSQTWFGSSE